MSRKKRLTCIVSAVEDGITYRFTDIKKSGDHYLAHLIHDDNTVGKMEHRITQEYDNGTFSDTDGN